MAHVSKITGLDWSYHSEHCLLTCSQDKQVKLWDITQPRKATETIQIGAPVTRAHYTVKKKYPRNTPN